MAQRLPSYIPARDYVSATRADSLRLPYTRKEALIKFQILEEKITSILEDSDLDGKFTDPKIKDFIVDMLNLGAHCIPNIVLDSPILDVAFKRFMKIDLLSCMDDMRKGEISNRVTISLK